MLKTFVACRAALVIAGLLSLFVANGADAAAVFAKNFGGTIAVQATIRATAVDASGNLHVGGFFDANLTLGSTTLTRIGAVDAFAAKFDPAGNVIWAKNFGGNSSSAFGHGLALDSAGNVYLAGYFQNATLSTPPFTKIGSYDAFVLKLDGSTGNIVWAKNFGGASVFAQAQGLAVDATGVYVAGYFRNGHMTTPPLTKTIGEANAFIFRLDIATGAVTWAKNYGGREFSFTYGQAVAADGAGNVYLGGTFDDDLVTPVLVRIGAQDAFVLKLDASTGASSWSRQFGGNGALAYGQALSVDSTGVYLGGYFQTANLTTPALTRIGNVDALIVKLDPSNGVPIWAKNHGGSGASAYGQALSADGAGTLYAGGHFQSANLTTPSLTRIGVSDAFALELDAATGATSWAQNFGGPGADARALTVAANGAAGVYAGGYFSGASLTSPTLAYLGNLDALVLKLDGGAGAIIRAANYGGFSSGGTALVTGVGVGALDHVFIGGFFTGNTLTLGTITLTRIGTHDAFAAKLDASGTVLWAKNFGGVGSTVRGNALTADNAGNVYLGANFDANLTTPALTKIGSNDIFVAKLDGATGVLTWAKNFGGGGVSATVHTLSADAAGSVYMGGFFSSGNLTTPGVTKIGSTDALVIRIDASTGNPVWGKSLGGIGATVFGQKVAANGAGAVYLAGSFSSANLTTPALTKIGTSDAFAVKLDAATGGVTWGKNFGGSGASMFGSAIATDASGSAWLGGNFATANLTTPALARIGTSDAFAIKLDALTGATSWAKNYGGTGVTSVFPSALAADSAGAIYLAGDFRNGNLTTPPMTLIGGRDVFAIRIDGATGTPQWARNSGGINASAFADAVAITGSGNTCIGGNFRDANLTAPPLTKIGTRDAVIICLSASAATLDIDVNQKYDALTDGLIVLRYLFGLTGSSMTLNALGPGATRTDPTQIKLYLDQVRPMLDIDDNGQTDALTDGLMLLRYLFGLRGDSLTTNAIGSNAKRMQAPQIEAYIQSLMP